MVVWYANFESSKILDWLYLGSIYRVRELTFNGNPMGFQAVLDVSTEEEYDRNPNILYLRVPFDDGYEIPPDKFSQCMAFLTFCKQKGLKTIVNCTAGISRSPSIVASFLFHSGVASSEFTPPLEDLDKILDYVCLCRPIVQPNSRVFVSCKKWLRHFPYDGSMGVSEPEGKLNKTIVANLLKLHTDLTCQVRASLLANDNAERHLLMCPCGITDAQ